VNEQGGGRRLNLSDANITAWRIGRPMAGKSKRKRAGCTKERSLYGDGWSSLGAIQKKRAGTPRDSLRSVCIESLNGEGINGPNK